MTWKEAKSRFSFQQRDKELVEIYEDSSIRFTGNGRYSIEHLLGEWLVWDWKTNTLVCKDKTFVKTRRAFKKLIGR